MTATEAEHLMGEWVGWLNAESELELIEFGDRVSDYLTQWMFVGIYSTERDRVMTGVRELVAEVASATSWRGLPYPPEWWPPSALAEGVAAP